MLSPPPGVTSFLAPDISIQTYLVVHGLHLSLSPLLAMPQCPHWAQGNRTPTVQHCPASWDISAPGSAIPSLSLQDHCGCCPLERPVLLSVSARRVSVNAPLILLELCMPPCQNWHQLLTVVVAHFRSVLVPEKK